VKLAFIHEDEAWFWILDESGQFWECWREEGANVAKRIPGLDCTRADEVAEHITNLALEAQVRLASTH
jgi:hypothetical protein